MEKREFLTAEEVAEMLKVNIMTIYRYIKAGKIKAYKFGKGFRITNEDLQKFVSSSQINRRVA